MTVSAGDPATFTLDEVESSDDIEAAFKNSFLGTKSAVSDSALFLFRCSQKEQNNRLDYFWYIIDENREVCALQCDDFTPLRLLEGKLNAAQQFLRIPLPEHNSLAKFATRHNGFCVFVRALPKCSKGPKTLVIAYADTGARIDAEICFANSTSGENPSMVQLIACDIKAFEALGTMPATSLSLAWVQAEVEAMRDAHPLLHASFREAIRQEGYLGYSLVQRPPAANKPLLEWALDVVARVPVDDPLAVTATKLIKHYDMRVHKKFNDPFVELLQDPVIYEALSYPSIISDKQMDAFLNLTNHKRKMRLKLNVQERVPCNWVDCLFTTSCPRRPGAGAAGAAARRPAGCGSGTPRRRC